MSAQHEFVSMFVSTTLPGYSCGCCCCRRHLEAGIHKQNPMCMKDAKFTSLAPFLKEAVNELAYSQTQRGHPTREEDSTSSDAYKQWSFFAPFCAVEEEGSTDSEEVWEAAERIQAIYNRRYCLVEALTHPEPAPRKVERDMYAYTPPAGSKAQKQDLFRAKAKQEITNSTPKNICVPMSKIQPKHHESFTASDCQHLYEASEQSSDSSIVVVPRAPKSSEVEALPQQNEGKIGFGQQKMNSPEYPVQVVLGELMLGNKQPTSPPRQNLMQSELEFTEVEKISASGFLETLDKYSVKMGSPVKEDLENNPTLRDSAWNRSKPPKPPQSPYQTTKGRVSLSVTASGERDHSPHMAFRMKSPEMIDRVLKYLTKQN